MQHDGSIHYIQQEELWTTTFAAHQYTFKFEMKYPPARTSQKGQAIMSDLEKDATRLAEKR